MLPHRIRTDGFVTSLQQTRAVRDLRSLSLVERKAKLEKLLTGAAPGILFNEHTDQDGATVFEHACRFGFEGIVSKRLMVPNRSGPSRDWVKVKKPDSAAMMRHREGRWEDGRPLLTGRDGATIVAPADSGWSPRLAEPK